VTLFNKPRSPDDHGAKIAHNSLVYNDLCHLDPNKVLGNYNNSFPFGSSFESREALADPPAAADDGEYRDERAV
jgi:hypothetical protein